MDTWLVAVSVNVDNNGKNSWYVQWYVRNLQALWAHSSYECGYTYKYVHVHALTRNVTHITAGTRVEMQEVWEYKKRIILARKG